MGLEELPPAELGEWFTEEKRLLAQRVLRAEYELGRSIAQIALDTGYSLTRVRKLLLREGVVLRSRAGKPVGGSGPAGRLSPAPGSPAGAGAAGRAGRVVEGGGLENR